MNESLLSTQKEKAMKIQITIRAHPKLRKEQGLYTIIEDHTFNIQFRHTPYYSLVFS